MDDSISDEINIVSSDEDVNVENVREEEDEDVDVEAVIESDDNDEVGAVVVDTADDRIIQRTVVDNDNAELDDSDETGVELLDLSIGGVASDHGQESPGSDEVAVVDNVVVEESDLNETSDEGEDDGGDEDQAPGTQGNEPTSIPAATSDTLPPPALPSTTPPPPAPPSTSQPGPSRSSQDPAPVHWPQVTVHTYFDHFSHGASESRRRNLPDDNINNESIAEFRSPKRRRVMSPVKTAGEGDDQSNVPGDNDEDDDDGNYCSICFEPWDNSGRHRLASLKCGHLFGLGCIEKWLRGQGMKCPTCNKLAKVKDVRVIYAKAIKMMDTTERDRALRELEQEKELRRRAELEAAQARLQCQQCLEETNRLREDITVLRAELTSVRSAREGTGSALPQVSSSQSRQLQGKFVHDKTVKIWEGGQCRVIGHCPSLSALVISQPSANHLFPGFGIKKLSCRDFKTSSYMTLHQKAVRDISFPSRENDHMLLSVSMDKTVKLTSTHTNTIVQTYTTELPLWSCDWNSEDPTYFFVGQQNGRVLEFDTRNTATNIRELNTEGSKSPVVALKHMHRVTTGPFKNSGLIVGQLDRVTFYETKEYDQYRLHILPLEGNLTSLHVEPYTRHMLASFRPTAKHATVRHQLCELTNSAAVGHPVISCNVVHTFHGGRSQSVLGKTMLMGHPADGSRLMVVAGDEQSESAHVWDTGTSQLMQRLPCQGVPVDFTTFNHNTTTFLAALTDKCVKLHKWS